MKKDNSISNQEDTVKCNCSCKDKDLCKTEDCKNCCCNNQENSCSCNCSSDKKYDCQKNKSC